MKAKHEKAKWIILGILQALILIGVIVDLALGVKISGQMDSLRGLLESQRSRSCAALPVELIHEDPACADKLIRMMNVSNVRILSRGVSASGPSGQE